MQSSLLFLINKRTLVVAFITGLCGEVFAASGYFRSSGESWNFADAGNWYTAQTGSTPLGRVPGSSDDAYLSVGTKEAPVLKGDSGTNTVARFELCNLAGSTGALRQTNGGLNSSGHCFLGGGIGADAHYLMEGGSFNQTASSTYYCAFGRWGRFQLDKSGGTMTIASGSVKPVMIGGNPSDLSTSANAVTGIVTQTGGTFRLTNASGALELGFGVGATGILTNGPDGTVESACKILVGDGGFGEIANDGELSMRCMQVGVSAGSIGHVVNAGMVRQTTDTADIHYAYALLVARNNSATGLVDVLDGGILQISNDVALAYGTSGTTANRQAVIRLAGGTLTSGDLSFAKAYDLNICDYADVDYGSVEASVTGYGTVEGYYVKNSGRIVADGMGGENDLVFTNNSIRPNANAGTGSGWYAVRKGRLVLPSFSGSLKKVTLGDYSASGDVRTNDLVNAVHVDAATSDYSRPWQLRLYAPGRSDIPTGLDAALMVPCVWSISSPTVAGASISFHFDATAFLCPEGWSQRVFLMRYDEAAAAWIVCRRLDGAEIASGYADVHDVSSTASDGLGFWAVVSRMSPNGTVIVIQ